MRRGPDRWIVDEEERLNAGVPIDVWVHIDTTKAQNRGWYVMESPSIEQLKKHVKAKLFVALEIDQCPFRMTFEGRSLNWSNGVTELEIKRIIMDHAKEQKRLAGEVASCLNTVYVE